MSRLQELYNQYITPPIDNNQKNSDIWGLLHILKHYATGCKHITEVGTRRGVSTVALMMAAPQKIVCFDVHRWDDIKLLEEIAEEENIEFVFRQEDILKAEVEDTDFAFLDSYHCAGMLSAELEKFKDKAKIIAMHDTTTFWEKPEPPYEGVDSSLDSRGLRYALEPFLATNKDWVQVYRSSECNGLTILKKNEPIMEDEDWYKEMQGRHGAAANAIGETVTMNATFKHEA